MRTDVPRKGIAGGPAPVTVTIPDPRPHSPTLSPADSITSALATLAEGGLTLRQVKEGYLRAVLEREHGCKASAARAAGVCEKTMYNLIGGQ